MMPQDFINSRNGVTTQEATIVNAEYDNEYGYIEIDNLDNTVVRIDSIDAAINEFKELYVEVTPYTKIPVLGGDCYQWSPYFIENCLIAFATDRLQQFGEDELLAFYTFINFENYHSTSAKTTDANGTACGCTIPDALNRSYVVANCGSIITTQLCQNPTYEVETEGAWKSLDLAFMALYNCEEINSCSSNDEMQKVPCSQ